MNFYPNFVPIQELSDWFEHWATAGVKPVFMCEYGAPFTLGLDDVSRAGTKGQREFGSARCRGNSASRNGTRNSLATGLSDQRTRRRRTCAGKRNSFAPEDVGIAGIIHFQVGSAASRRAIRVRAVSHRQLAGLSRPGGVRRFHRGNTSIFGNCATASNNARQELKVDWENLQRPGLQSGFHRSHATTDGSRLIEICRLDPASSRRRRSSGTTAACSGFYRRQAGSISRAKDHNFLRR